MRETFKGKNVVLISMPFSIVQWFSQRLMIQTIQEFWSSFAEQENFCLEIIEASPGHLVRAQQKLRAADLLVFSWNGPIFIEELRGRLGINTPCLFYLAGEGSRGFAYSIGKLEFLRSTDLFICVSRAEEKTLRLCFPDSSSLVCPYPNLVPPKGVLKSGIRVKDKCPRVVYIGRYSEQKNLHLFLWALYILQGRGLSIPLVVDLYGFEDGLGSPNMRAKFPSYQKYLMGLVRKLELEQVVKWHGFVKNSILTTLVQSSPHIFVSPSLYSEECFGLAAFDSLIRGNDAVLTDWGGHRDLKGLFPAQVTGVPVRGLKWGPFISPFDLADSIENRMKNFRVHSEFTLKVPRNYTQKWIQRQLVKRTLATIRKNRTTRRLTPSVWVVKVHKQIRTLNSNLAASMESLDLRVFNDYSDALALLSFKKYGMKRPEKSFFAYSKSSQGWIAPWVRIGRREIVVQDPHRGKQRCALRGSSESIILFTYNRNKVTLSPENAQWLFERGYLFFKESKLSVFQGLKKKDLIHSGFSREAPKESVK